MPDARFLVVGGGRTLPQLQEHAARIGLGDRVVFTGAVPADRVPELLDCADVAVATLPDTEQARTKSPLKVVEYMAAGKAVVASRVGEAVTFLDEGRAGVLVPPGDPTALGHAVAELLLDPEQLVVLRHPIRAAQRARLDLARVGRNGDVGDRDVLGLARAVADDGGVIGLFRHLDGVKRFGQGADLVHLHED